MATPKRGPVLFVSAPAPLIRAVKIAAATESTTVGKYVREAVIARLKSEGIDVEAR